MSRSMKNLAFLKIALLLHQIPAPVMVRQSPCFSIYNEPCVYQHHRPIIHHLLQELILQEFFLRPFDPPQLLFLALLFIWALLLFLVLLFIWALLLFLVLLQQFVLAFPLFILVLLQQCLLAFLLFKLVLLQQCPKPFPHSFLLPLVFT